jgi:hypothetical protein
MGMITLLDAAWVWLAIGLVLIGLETIVSGIFLFWLGLAALATALVVFVLPLAFAPQLGVFGLLSLATVFIGHRLQGRQKDEITDAPHLNERGKALVGQVFPLESDIVDGTGQVRIGDTVWRVAGPELPAGARVRITGLEGATLTVTPA